MLIRGSIQRTISPQFNVFLLCSDSPFSRSPETENFLHPSTLKRLHRNFRKKIRLLNKSVINSTDKEGYTPMHLSSFYGDYLLTQYYLKHGGDPGKTDSVRNQQVLDYASNDLVRRSLIDLKEAARLGDKKKFDLLLNTGSNINAKKTIFSIAPIHTVSLQISSQLFSFLMLARPSKIALTPTRRTTQC